MTVFNTVLKIINKYKFNIILYTALLITFAGVNFKSGNNTTNFIATKPDVYIINYDENKGITKDLIKYLNKNTNIKKLDNNKEAINDALFYRDVNYIIYIPKGFREDFLKGENPKIKIKTTNDYNSVLAENLLDNYIKTLNIYLKNSPSEQELIKKVNKTISTSTKVKITSKLDTNTLSQVAFYFNFLNYSILAGCVYVICLILSSFKEEKIHKRMMISSTSYKRINQKLLLSLGVIALLLWIFYIALAFILLGKVIFEAHGILYIINSFIFMIVSLCLAFLIGNIVNSKTAINGIINVVALGSSFLCGAFVPMEWLPKYVVSISHILPSYWYIKTNELIKTIEIINLKNIEPLIKNGLVLIIFMIIFITITNIISKKKRRIN